MQVLNEDIKKSKFKHFYILTGNDEFLIHSYKKRLFQMISMENPMNQAKFAGERVDVDAFIDMANTLPFLSDARCILVEDSGWFKLGKNEQSKGKGEKSQTLLQAMVHFPKSTYVIFVERNVDKRSALYKQIAKLGYVATLNHPSREQMTDWVLRRLHQNGKKITHGNMNLFLDYVGDDLERVGNELDKLMAYTLDKDVILQEDIERITSVNVENRIFEMVEDIALGRMERAVRKFRDLMDLKVSPFLIMNLIARQFNQMLFIKSMFDRNLSDEDMAKKLGVRPFVIGKLMTAAKRYSIERLKEILEQILDLEMYSKNGEMDADNACMLMIAGSYTKKTTA